MSKGDLINAARALFPESELSVRPRSPHDPRAMRFVSPGKGARLAVPSSSHSAASKTIHRPSAGDSFYRSALRGSLAVAERMRILQFVTPDGITVDHTDGSIVDHLSEVFGQQVLIGLMVGSSRANQKPVLNVFSVTGEELGFAKVGLGALSNRLVASEAEALRRLSAADLKEMRVPSLISSDPWRTHSVLVMSALRADRIQRPLSLPILALNELGNIATSTGTAVRDSVWAGRIATECASVGGPSPLRELVAVFLERYGDDECDLAPWHGDFGPWNMARTSSVPMVWDWERFAASMPRGMDALHFLIHRDIAGKYGSSISPLRLNAAADHVRSLHGSSSRRRGSTSANFLLAAYLLTYATRFVSDGLSQDVPRTTQLGLRYAEHLHRLLFARDNLSGE